MPFSCWKSSPVSRARSSKTALLPAAWPGGAGEGAAARAPAGEPGTAKARTRRRDAAGLAEAAVFPRSRITGSTVPPAPAAAVAPGRASAARRGVPTGSHRPVLRRRTLDDLDRPVGRDRPLDRLLAAGGPDDLDALRRRGVAEPEVERQ